MQIYYLILKIHKHINLWWIKMFKYKFIVIFNKYKKYIYIYNKKKKYGHIIKIKIKNING